MLFIMHKARSITFSLNDELFRRFKELCEKKMLNRSKVIERLISNFIEENKEEC